ncbi:MAG: UDP-glucuronic acid dehydrogenase [Candidatus Schekmanbacteria bacterium RBG_16_38_10]|uniref:UDP-glucuronic acid dehydrogenase n=1 Tax=Candidatus Schekmanbacteria bacterium RBG_16_38_10 TaxID=1817879 RepID=A0A1F7S2M4_9BACT|nr:MAG: UDP-glucuronic acid dehydrogenase [Candidatus Schekmanbacteria bacterium RBG_16_38_10]
MKLSILTTDPRHPVVPRLQQWQGEMETLGHSVSLFFDKKDLTNGDILFLVSCGQMIGDTERQKFRAALVLHASDLPKGRGWSPHIWSIVNGANQITVCLLEAMDPVDSGAIWYKTEFTLEGHELLREINEKLFAAELSLMTQAVQDLDVVTPTLQSGASDSYMQKRTPEHSRLNVNKSLAEQFDLLRVVDNERYPAFFDHRGKRYQIKIEKVKNEL